MSDYLKAWQEAKASGRRVIAIDLAYIDLNDGNHADAAMFAQIMYWFEPGHDGTTRAKVERDGARWLVKQHGDWWAECRITERTARRCLERIQTRGLIHVETHFSPVHRGEDGRPVKAQFIRLASTVGDRLREWVQAHVIEETATLATSTNGQSGQNVTATLAIYSDVQTAKPDATKTETTYSEKTKQTAVQLPANGGSGASALSSWMKEKLRYWLGIQPHEIPDKDVAVWSSYEGVYSRVDIEAALEIARPKFWAGEIQNLPRFVGGTLQNRRPLTDAEREELMGGWRGGSDDIEY